MAKELDMKPYKPSNSIEADLFQAAFCDVCKHIDTGCDIVVRAMAYDIGEAEYPAEWSLDENGHPECTAFEARKEQS